MELTPVATSHNVIGAVTCSSLETKFKQLSAFKGKIIISKPILVLYGLRRRLVAP